MIKIEQHKIQKQALNLKQAALCWCVINSQIMRSPDGNKMHQNIFLSFLLPRQTSMEKINLWNINNDTPALQKQLYLLYIASFIVNQFLFQLLDVI